MNKIRIQFELNGLHARMFEAVLECTNRAPGRPLTESALARSLVQSILDEDAREHGPGRPN